MGRGKGQRSNVQLDSKNVLFKTNLDPRIKSLDKSQANELESGNEWWNDPKYSKPYFDKDKNAFYDSVGGKVIYIHNKKNCKGRGCPVHHPSDHEMKKWPMSWNLQVLSMERVCEHGIRHPDPDDYKFRQDNQIDIPDHAKDCDGCCDMK